MGWSVTELKMSQPNEVFLRLAEETYAKSERSWQDHFLERCKRTKRSLRRWQTGKRLPGPVRAMILAHAKCRWFGVPF